jgi:CBS domain containing-hemolysin-like protein
VTGQVASWLGDPVTLTLAGSAMVALFLVIEVLLHSLAEIGNVRFQGLLEDHPGLLPTAVDSTLHLSRLTGVLRWLQIVSVGLLWLVLLRFPGLDAPLTVTLGVAVPLLIVVLSWVGVGTVGERGVAVLLRLVRPLAWPLLLLLSRSGPGPQLPAANGDDEEEASEREIQAYLEAGQAAGILEGEEGEFFQSLVDFFDTVAREVMTPRTEMVALPSTVSHRELLETVITTGKSRIPVYEETVDRILGVVHVKDLVQHLARGQEPPVTDLLRACPIVPEGKVLGELLREFQQGHQQLAIVVDEYGGTSGLVTLEDIIEEIVGEIVDEHDPKEPPDVEELRPGVYRLQGRASLELFKELYGIEVEEEDVDTVGGLVFSRHGTVPEEGTTVEDTARGLHFTVDEK